MGDPLDAITDPFEDAIDEVGDFVGDHGAAIGTLAGAAAAPFTGGLSLGAGAALGGAAGSIAQGALADTPSFHNPLEGTLEGGSLPEFTLPNFDFSSPFSSDVSSAIDAIDPARSEFGNTLAATRDLRSRFRPGFSELRRAALNSVDDARRRGLSNLRDSLNRRNVLGSSFASDTISRAESEFARQRANVASQSFLKELEATAQTLNLERKLIQDDIQAILGKGELAASAFATDVQRQASEKGLALEALNAEREFFTDLQGLSLEAQKIQAELAAEAQAGKGALVGQGINSLVDIFTSGEIGGSDSNNAFSTLNNAVDAVPFANQFNPFG